MGILSRECDVRRMAREANFAYLKREGTTHFLVVNDGRRKQYIVVRHEKGYDNSIFQLFFPTRFALDKLPDGLCARVMMRGHDLLWSAWKMCIAESCEAAFYVAASVPYRSVDSRLFGEICNELQAEVEGFGKELRDRFAYTMGDGIVYPEQPKATGTAIVPQHARYPVPRR